MTSKRVFSASLAACGLVFVAACGNGGGESAASTEAVSPEQQALIDTVKGRQANLKDLGAAFKAISDEMKAGTPASTTVEYSIKSVQQYANGIENWFPEGSGPELGIEMAAKPEIWTQPEDFATKVSDFQAAVANLTAASGDPAAIPAAFGGVGKTCKSCHDTYKEED